MTSVRALEALFVANPDFELIEQSRDVFCPFEAVGMVRQETRHGHFLAYCLDPQRPHGFGSECIRALLRSAAHAQREQAADFEAGNITPLDVHLMDFEKTQIRREWRSIDLLALVNEEKLVVAIELKIDSTEHSGQLRRYRERVSAQWPTQDGWRHLFIYLTKHGDEASEEDGDGWLALHLDVVARELGGIVQKQVGTPESLTLLKAYLNMLRRHHLTDDHLEELAAKLWSQHREALDFLMERRPDAAFGLFGQIFERRMELAEKMTAASGLNVVVDDSSVNIVRFGVRDWDALSGFLSSTLTSSKRLLVIELQGSSDKKKLRIRFVLGPADPSIRNSYYKALVEAGAPTTKRKLTDTYTRLGSKSFDINDDDEVEDTSALFERVLTQVQSYAKDMIPRYDVALSSFRN